MEIIKLLLTFTLIVTLGCCSNTPELETGEIKTLQLLKQTFGQSKHSKNFIDARNLLNREQIDATNMPVLFVELASGQNGTLTPYPGQGVGQTWLGADGATITLESGVIKASRGMGDDIMGSSTFIPPWSKSNSNPLYYIRKISYLTGDNKISTRSYKCKVHKNNQKEIIKIWELEFIVTKFEENCDDKSFKITNIYYVDDKEIVRRSLQYHSDTIGYVSTERLDR